MFAAKLNRISTRAYCDSIRINVSLTKKKLLQQAARNEPVMLLETGDSPELRKAFRYMGIEFSTELTEELVRIVVVDGVRKELFSSGYLLIKDFKED